MAPRKATRSPKAVISVKGHDYTVQTGNTGLTLALAQSVAADVMSGKTLTGALRDRKLTKSVYFKWMSQFDWLRALMNEAHEFRADTMADEIIDIADDRSQDMYHDEHHGTDKPNMAAVARAKLRVETRKHLMGKFNPRKYAEKHLALEEGLGGLQISWGGGHGVARITQRQLKQIEQTGAIAPLSGTAKPPQIIEGELVHRGDDE
jgi:hypothetical protein